MPFLCPAHAPMRPSARPDGARPRHTPMARGSRDTPMRRNAPMPPEARPPKRPMPSEAASAAEAPFCAHRVIRRAMRLPGPGLRAWSLPGARVSDAPSAGWQRAAAPGWPATLPAQDGNSPPPRCHSALTAFLGGRCACPGRAPERGASPAPALATLPAQDGNVPPLRANLTTLPAQDGSIPTPRAT